MTTTTPAIERGYRASADRAFVSPDNLDEGTRDLHRDVFATGLAAALNGPELDAETLARKAYEDWCNAHQLLPLWETAGKSEKRRWLLTAQALLATLHTTVLGKKA